MKKIIRNTLCILLSFLMLTSAMPLSAVAEELRNIQIKPKTKSVSSAPVKEYEGMLLSAEIVIGDVKQIYETDENGVLTMIGEEPVKKRGLFRAPKKESTGMENVPLNDLVAAAQWALSHNADEAYLMVDQARTGMAVYGVGGYDAAVQDADFDGICDLCGYCLDGCTDGSVLSYSEADIAEGPDGDGKYYNADGTWIGTDAVGTYTYRVEDEHGNPVYDEHGNPKTTTTEYAFISFQSYQTNADGVCDACGKQVCRADESVIGHDYSDGLCDGCGACAGEHTDEPASPEETADGICDVCGYCVADCADSNTDGTCDVCGKSYLSGCVHSDLIGLDNCSVCAQTPCHMTLMRMQQIRAQLSMMEKLLREADANGDASYHAWLETTFTPALTAKEDGGSDASFASAVSRRDEARTIRQSQMTFNIFRSYLDGLTADDVRSDQLGGTLERDGDTVTLNEDGTLYAQLKAQQTQYNNDADSVVYPENRGYYTYLDSDFFSGCKEKLDQLTGEVYDAQLAAVFGDKIPKKISVTDQNARTLRNAADAVSEALLYRLYGAGCRDDIYSEKAEAVWRSGASAGSDNETRRCVGFALLQKVIYAVNERKEAAFISFSQKHYDLSGVYAVRLPVAEDYLRDPARAADTYTVTDETIRTLVSRIDRYLGSEEAAVMLQRFIPSTIGLDVKDVNEDGLMTIYDLAMSYLMQVVFSDDVINEIFSMIFPTVTDLAAGIPDMLSDNDYITYKGNGRYTIDLFKAIILAAGGSNSVANTISDVSNVLGFSGSFLFDIDGSNANSLEEVLTKAGFSFWPLQVANLVLALNEAKYESVVTALTNCGDDWHNLLDKDGKLNLHWGLETFDDFKQVLSVLFGAVSPVLQALFTDDGTVTMQMRSAIYFSLAINLGSIAIPAASDGGVDLKVQPFSYYRDVVAPIFEALGVNSFAPEDGSYAPTYTFRDIRFENITPSTHNVSKVVDGIVDPLMVLVEQFVSHPLEKLLSILPNLAILTENGALPELLDLSGGLSAIIKANFNMSVSSFFKGIKDIVEDQIMRHWYDWLNPTKYAQVVYTVAAYSVMEPVLAAVFKAFGDIDAAYLVREIGIDFSDEFNSIISEDVFPALPALLESAAAALGGKLTDGATDFDWPKDVDLKINPLLQEPNIYPVLLAYLLSPEAVQAMGFNLGKLSSVLTWMLDNLVDQDGNPIHLFDPALLDLETLSSLGALEVRGDSIRDARYAERWNELGVGEYYFVHADIADVFYYGLKLITGILNDKTAVQTLLSMIGMEYSDLKDALADVAANGADTLSLTLSEILTDACDENGKLDIDRLLSGITTDDLLLVLCETIVPENDYAVDDYTYPEASEAAAAEIGAHGGTIPYLEYDNAWSRKIARFAVNDADDLIDTVLQELPYDLDPSTEEIERLREYAKPILLRYLNEPAYLTLIAQILAGVYDDSLALPADIVKDATGIDITGWTNDFAYLFDASASAPSSKKFPLLTGTRTGRDADGNPLVAWTYKGKPVETYSDILYALAYLLAPAQPLLDMVLCGEDFKVLTYSENGQVAGSLVTVKGHDGYNFAILPLLEAMGIDKNKLLTSDQFREKGAAEGVMYCLDLVVEHLFEIFDSDTMVADLLEMMAQVTYALSGNGTNTILKNLMHPLLVLVDTLRPVLNIDLDAAINMILCNVTYKIGGYANAQEMRSVLKERNAAISLRTLDLNSILRVIGVICSGEKDGARRFLEIEPVFRRAVDDLAYLRKPYVSKAYKLDENGQRTKRQAFRLDLDGADALTVMISMGIEILLYGNNADIIDAVLREQFGLGGLVKAATELMRGLQVEYSTAYDWAYILGGNASAEEKAALLAAIKENGAVSADDHRTAGAQQDFETYLKSYELTDWDEDTAVYLVDHLDAMISTLLSVDTGGKSLGALLLEGLDIQSDAKSFTTGSFLAALVNGMLTDEPIDKVLGFIGDFLNGRDNEFLAVLAGWINDEEPEAALEMLRDLSKKLATYRDALCKIADAIGVDLSAYDIDSTRTVYTADDVTYYNFAGEPTGLERPVIKENLSNIEDVLYAVLEPVRPVLSFLLLGEDLYFFNASGAVESRERRDDLVRVAGVEGYRYVLLPLLEALGCKGLKSADSYVRTGSYNSRAFLRDLLTSVAGRIRSLLNEDNGSTMNTLVEMLPNVLYYINSNGFGVALQNLTAQITALLDLYNTYAGKGDDALTLEGLLNELTGMDVDLTKVSLTDLFALISVKDEETGAVYPLSVDEFIRRLLDQFTVGRICYNAQSACDFDTFGMAYRNSQDKAKTVTILISLLLDVIEDPDNKDFFTALLGAEVYQTVCNLFDLEALEFDYQEPTWLFTDDVNQLALVSAREFSEMFGEDPYAGRLWTKERAAKLADRLDSFVENVLYLLGLEINGVEVRSFRTLVHALIGETVFSDQMLNTIAGLLGEIKPYLDQYDPDGEIAGFIKELLNVDLHAWDAYAPGGEYENGRDWGFSKGRVDEAAVDANGAIFEAGLCELLTPAAPILAWLLADRDYTVFVEGDGLGENTAPIQITIPGSEGYRYGLIPLFEALNIDGNPYNLAQNLRDADICDPAVFTRNVQADVNFAVEGVVHPLVVMLQKLMDSSTTDLLELLPSIVYFINSNGLDTLVQNLMHAVQLLANSIEPIHDQIGLLVYNEQGVDLYKTLDVETIVKENVYDLLGVTEEQVQQIYEQSGGTWPTIDGAEDLDFRLLFSFAIAFLNNLLAEKGLPFKFTSIAGMAVNELTCGYVRSYISLTGRTAYTMVLDKTIDRYCYGELLTLLFRIALKFLEVDGNLDALMGLLSTKVKMGKLTYKATYKFLSTVTCYLQTRFGFGSAMLMIYFKVFTAAVVSGKHVAKYSFRNAIIRAIINWLLGVRSTWIRNGMLKLVDYWEQKTGDVFTSDGFAPHGYVPFFKQIISWFQSFFASLRNAFRR